MEDQQIIQMLTIRDQQAIHHLSEKYSAYCRRIAANILTSQQDIEEVISDTFLQVWHSIPPACPDHLGAYAATITRNLAFNKYRQQNAARRGGGNIPLVLSELSDVVSNDPTPQEILEAKEMTQAINDFLATLSDEKRYIFVRRYWFADSVETIAHSLRRTRPSVSITLTRLRRKLHTYLTERGFDL